VNAASTAAARTPAPRLPTIGFICARGYLAARIPPEMSGPHEGRRIGGMADFDMSAYLVAQERVGCDGR
jgi:hypothetical protein